MTNCVNRGKHLAVTTESTEVFALTRQLVRYRSYTPGAAQSAMDFINGWFGARGLETIRYSGVGPRGELTALVVRVGSGGPRILLHGHVGVVPGEEAQVESRGGKGERYGRGGVGRAENTPAGSRRRGPWRGVAVRVSGGERGALRAWRLRHEGRPGRDDVR